MAELNTNSDITHSNNIAANLTLSFSDARDFGLITLSLRFPRFLSPDWGIPQWEAFLKTSGDEICNSVSEFLIQSTSLSYAKIYRRNILAHADTVVIDFRGDLFNSIVPLPNGGYKIGVYRDDRDWPTWLAICPTYDLAVEEAQKIAKEAGIKKIKRVGKLANPWHDTFGNLTYSSQLQRALVILTLFFGVGLGAIGTWLLTKVFT